MEKEFSLIIFTENHVGVLNQITNVFTRRHINIDSLTVSETEIKGISRFTIVVSIMEEMVIKVTKQIEKMVDVLVAFYTNNDEIVWQEIALYKVPLSALSHREDIEQLLRTTNARILTVEVDYAVIEKTGYKEETQDLFLKLEPYGVLQFVRSGRIAVTKSPKELSHYLKDLEKANVHSHNIRSWKLNNEDLDVLNL